MARAVYKDAADCPSISLDGTAQAMSVRMRPQTGEKAAFPVLVCELPIPSGTQSAVLGKQALPSVDKWGFTIFTPQDGAAGWNATYYRTKGNDKFTCGVTPTSLSCP